MVWLIHFLNPEKSDMTILLVNSDALGINLADMLEKKGYSILQVSDADKALEFVRKFKIRLVLYFGKMADLAGLGLCRNIRSEKKDHYIYFIMAIPMDEKKGRFEGLKQGVDSYIGSPVDPDELLAMVQVGMRISEFTLPEARKKNLLNKADIGEYDICFARIALEKKMLTKEQLAKAFSLQKKEKMAGKEIALDKIFFENRMLSSNIINDLHAVTKMHMERKFGFFALKKGFATSQQVEQALKEQAREFKENQIYKKTGDILVAQGAITEEEREIIRIGMEKTAPVFPKETKQIDGSIHHEETEQIDRSLYSITQVLVSENRLEAHIQHKNNISIKITPEEILAALTRDKILFGVVDLEEIAEAMNNSLDGEKSFLAARGRAAIPASDASIEYHFDANRLTVGIINEDGNMDYRGRGSIPRVKSSDLLATKIPMKRGEPGIDVHNNLIPVIDPEDIQLKCGEGAELSQDGLKVYAKIDGQPNLAVDGTISVFAELIIDGDVDFNIGNIVFDGNVIVKGTIINGFTVKCGNLSAKEISGATILAMGDVIVSGGIFGADIKTEGDVKAKFIADSNIKSFRNVMVDKEVIGSKIRSSGSFVSERGRIVSSFISAKMGFKAKEIGTEVSSPCRINVGMDENVKKRIQALNYGIDDKKKVLETVQKHYENESKNQEAIHLKITELAQVQERLISAKRSVIKEIRESEENGLTGDRVRMQANLLALEKRFETVDLQINNCFTDQEMLDEIIAQDLVTIEAIIAEIEVISGQKEVIMKWSKEEKGVPVIKVSGRILQGTKLFGSYSSLFLKETIQKVTIREIKQTDSDTWQMMILDF